MMRKLLLYFILLSSFVPLISHGKARPWVSRHIAAPGKSIDESDLVNTADSMRAFILPVQDTLGSGKRKRIKEVARSKPQPAPEKIGKHFPPDGQRGPANARRPDQRPPQAHPQGGRGRPQPPPRRGR